MGGEIVKGLEQISQRRSDPNWADSGGFFVLFVIIK